jgi:hypothetical protein
MLVVLVGLGNPDAKARRAVTLEPGQKFCENEEFQLHLKLELLPCDLFLDFYNVYFQATLSF